MPKLDLMIVGAQKAGTTSLKNYLAEHPEISSHVQTEFTYFLNGEELKKGFDIIFKSQFVVKESYHKIIAKNVAMAQNESGLQELKAHNPECKIVYILREPVARAYSAYTMAVKDGWMKRPFDDIIEVLNNKEYEDQMYRFFVKQSFYIEYIERLLKYFPAENIKYLRFEDLKNNPEKICRELYEWLNVNPEFTPSLNLKHNVTTQIKSESFLKATNYFRNENNPVKKLAKAILPYKLFNKIGSSIQDLNMSKTGFEKISTTSEKVLKEHFQEKNQKLKSITGIKY